MAILYTIVSWAFWVYTILLMVRILVSWVPDWQRFTWVRFVSFYTDPYLGVFRRIVPPIGGVLDLSPLLAFFALRFAETVILGWLR